MWKGQIQGRDHAEIYKAIPYNQELLPKELCSGPTKTQLEPFVPCQPRRASSRDQLEKLVPDITESAVLHLTTLINRTKYFKGTYFGKVLYMTRDQGLNYN